MELLAKSWEILCRGCRATFNLRTFSWPWKTSCEFRTIIIWQGKSERSDWFFLGRDFAIRTVSVETVIICVFLSSKGGKFKTSMARVPYNKLRTNQASSSRSGVYWPSVVFLRTSLRSVRAATTAVQYSHSTSKRLVLFSLNSVIGNLTSLFSYPISARGRKFIFFRV